MTMLPIDNNKIAYSHGGDIIKLAEEVKHAYNGHIDMEMIGNGYRVLHGAQKCSLCRQEGSLKLFLTNAGSVDLIFARCERHVNSMLGKDLIRTEISKNEFEVIMIMNS